MTHDITQLAQQLGEILLAKNWQITCAESCTGGGIGYAITSISGSSAWFKKGFITYSNQAKQELINVNLATLEKHGAVSNETVAEMAKGAAQQAQAELAVSVSGIAGPDGGTANKPVGTVCFGFCLDGHIHTKQVHFSGDRQAVRLKAIEYALTQCLSLLTK